MKRQLKVGMGALGLVIVATWLARTVRAQGPEWPLEIDDGGAHIVLYQPQPESLQDDKLAARAAVSVQRKGDAEPAFGAIWIEARVATDRDARTVTVLDVKVPTVKFPGETPEQESALVKVIQEELPKQQHTFALDSLLTTLDQAVKPGDGAPELKYAPPHIVFAKMPTVLVTIDGQPKLQAIQSSSVMHVVNTPFVILFEPAKKTYYVEAGDKWVKAQGLEGPWTDEPRPPSEVMSALPPRTIESEAGAQVTKEIGDARILVATEPTELIVCDGEPKWTPLQGNELLYLSNSENDVFMELGSQQIFVLLAGRWYTSPSLDKGAWTYVPADKLPAAFAHIQPGTEHSAVRTFVAGTDEARDALLDAAIPQTSAVKRSDAHCNVTYDGDPRFEPIQGTQLRYAVNTGSSVIEFGGKYYCCSEAVWFVADAPLGPWTVCTQVPPEVYTIPPSCPVYPVRYVYVYDSTPEVVYVGYLPGYVGCYAAGPTIVYGTGYWYPGWYGSAYYPRPCTWGFRPHYNPWTCGWSFGFGFGWGVNPGWFSLSVGWGHPGWWGHGGFGGSHFDMHGHVVRLHASSGPPINVTWMQSHVGHNNIYNRPENVGRSRIVANAAGVSTVRGRVSGQRPNDLYVDRDGRVLRRTNEGWQERRADGWKSAEQAQPVQPPFSRGENPATPRTPPPLIPPGNPAPGGAPPVARPMPVPPREDFEHMQRAREQGAARASALQQNRGQGTERGNKPRG